jgi:hypothetical protein
MSTRPKKKWSEFLTSTPPHVAAAISDIKVGGFSGAWTLQIPSTHVQMYCDNFGGCGTDRTFAFECSEAATDLNACGDHFFLYSCRNCETMFRTFAISFSYFGGPGEVLANKVGEEPPFGPPIPSKVVSLIGPDRDLFLKGYQAEIHGQGIGAFAYYRRVVENQTQRLFARLRQAAERIGDQSAVALLERASSETQFTRAVEMVKDGLPERLWIHNHNPLTLLHNATSNDLHAGTDEDCLEVATNIRVVLTELAVRIAEVTREDDGLKQSVIALANRPKKMPTVDS